MINSFTLYILFYVRRLRTRRSSSTSAFWFLNLLNHLQISVLGLYERAPFEIIQKFLLTQHQVCTWQRSFFHFQKLFYIKKKYLSPGPLLLLTLPYLKILLLLLLLKACHILFPVWNVTFLVSSFFSFHLLFHEWLGEGPYFLLFLSLSSKLSLMLKISSFCNLYSSLVNLTN